MGGIGLSWNLNRIRTHTRYAHTRCTHTHAHTQDTYTHIRTHTQQTYMQHIHSIQNTEYNNHAAHTEQIQHRCNREQRTTSTHRTTQSCTHSFDFYHWHIYIKKLYNIAIYVFYTFCSPYLWGEQIE